MPVVIGAKPESTFANPIGLLSDCHRRVEHFLRVLDQISNQARGKLLSEEQRAAWDTALRYFREAAPKHTADEEESLFPRLRAVNRPDVEALLARVDQLEKDHVVAGKAHDEVDRLGRRWLEVGSLPPEQASRLGDLLAKLTKLYSAHISIEDNEVFPLATIALSSSDRTAIGAEMASRRGLKAELK